jgi:hypothetical protein
VRSRILKHDSHIRREVEVWVFDTDVDALFCGAEDVLLVMEV